MSTGTETWEPPKCSHGNIIFGCPHDDCPEQVAALRRLQSAIAGFEEEQQREARRIVRGLLGLPQGNMACGCPYVPTVVVQHGRGCRICDECGHIDGHDPICPEATP